jgi:hypothetical protein
VPKSDENQRYNDPEVPRPNGHPEHVDGEWAELFLETKNVRAEHEQVGGCPNCDIPDKLDQVERGSMQGHKEHTWANV